MAKKGKSAQGHTPLIDPIAEFLNTAPVQNAGRGSLPPPNQPPTTTTEATPDFGDNGLPKREYAPSPPVSNVHPVDPRGRPALNQEQMIFNEQLLDMIHNDVTSRQQFFDTLMDPRRNINKECGYPETSYISANDYRQLYDRLAPATRLVNLFPDECWQVQPHVYEQEDPDTQTPFEEGWDNLGRTLRGGSYYQDEDGSPIWEHLKRADRLSRIARFGVILVGINDGKLLDQPVDWVKLKDKSMNVVPDLATKDITGISTTIGSGDPAAPIQPIGTSGTDLQYLPISMAPQDSAQQRKEYLEAHKDEGVQLLFVRTYDEALIQIVQYEASIHSPRFGQPVVYLITLNDPRYPHSGVGLPLATVRVHWSRIIHIADNLGSSEIFGVPAMQPCLNNLLDLRKLYGGSAEMFWKGAFMGISFETHPQLGGDVKINQRALQTQIDNYQNTTQRWLALMGMSAKTLAPQVSDPTAFIEVQIEAMCIQIGCPVRIFKGSERGELASEQDMNTWGGRLSERRKNYLTPKVIVPFVDRLIKVGVLPEPEGFSVVWPEVDTLSKTEKAAIATQRTTAMGTYVMQNISQLMAPQDYLTKELGYTDEEAEAILENTEDHLTSMQDDPEMTPGQMPAPGQPTPGGFDEDGNPLPPQDPTDPNASGQPPDDGSSDTNDQQQGGDDDEQESNPEGEAA